MTRIRIALLAAAMAGAPLLPAGADSQSSNSSSNCSNGRCSRVETYVEERDGRRWGYRDVQTWRERPDNRQWRQVPPWAWQWHAPRPRYQRDRDDD